MVRLSVLQEIPFTALDRVPPISSIVVMLLCLAGGMFFAGTRTEAQTQFPAPAKWPEVLRRFPLTKFYDTSNPLPAGKPGELFRSAEFNEYDLSAGVSAVRIVYHSRSATGNDVAASGVVLFPDGKPPDGGWPLIAWAHGSSGVARQCAPSLARNVQHGPFLSMYVNLGYAVVATDYTGLGTSFRNAFADMQSNATDVIYSVRAARAAVPQIGSRWIAMGAGEGGMAVVGVAEMEHEIQDPSYLGSVAISQLADLQDVYEPVKSVSPNVVLSLAYGIKTVYPQFDVNDMLSDKALPMYHQIDQTCRETEAAKSPANEMLKPNWNSNQFVQQYFSRNRLGEKPASAPMLVISSEVDPSITETTKIIARMCRQGDRVQFERYPQSDPAGLMGDSVRDQMSWIQARFAGGPVRSNC